MVLIIIALALGALAGPSHAKKNVLTPEAKKQQIKDLAAQSKTTVITLDDSSFAYYAVSKPRPYSLIVFLTASHPKFKCTICRDIERDFATVAQSYSHSGAKEATGSDTEEVFFVRLDFESSQQVFSKYGVTGVPLVFHIPPFRGEKALEDYNIKPRDRFNIPQVPDVDSIVNFVRDRTGAHIEIKRSMMGAYIALMAVFVAMALSVQPAINNLPALLGLLRNKGLWMFVSLSVYTCAISGLIFDIIRSPPMYYMNPQTGQIMFFYPQSGSQFVVEGFVIGFLNLGCAISLLVLALYVPRMRTKGPQGAITPRTWVFGVCFVGSIGFFYAVKSLYRMKNRWYRG